MRPRGPVPSARTRVWARVIDAVIDALLATIVLALGPADRPWARWFLVVVVLTAYELVCVAALGATLGKLTLGLRVVELDRTGRPRPIAALRRGLITALLASIPVVGWVGWLLTTLLSPLRRGAADRAAGTIVVRHEAALPITTASLPGYADGEESPRMGPLGRVADLDSRRRARLRRLADAPVLVVAMTVLLFFTLLPTTKRVIVLVCAAVWLVVFVVDETWRVARFGATAGHRAAGLAIRSVDTGEPPRAGRSLSRAVVLALTLYVPLLWPLLGLSLIMAKASGSGRALHDYAGRTVVVADPRLDPEEQRQRAMALRLGKAG